MESFDGLTVFFIIMRAALLLPLPSYRSVVEFIWPLVRPELMECFLITWFMRLLPLPWIMAPCWAPTFYPPANCWSPPKFELFGVINWACIALVTDWLPWYRIVVAFCTLFGMIDPMPLGYIPVCAPMKSIMPERCKSLLMLPI